jgi:hypothetical protein
MNAKKELLDHLRGREVKYVRVILKHSYDNNETIEGTLDEVLPKLDFDYDNGYGGQYMEGTIWYSDETWSDRGEYDGSEWWEHRECPSLPNAESTHSESAPMTSSTHLVDCNSYTGELHEYPTISEALAENRIVEVTKDEDGRFKVSEMCDEWYSIYLTAAQLRVWADELRAMADAPNA